MPATSSSNSPVFQAARTRPEGDIRSSTAVNVVINGPDYDALSDGGRPNRLAGVKREDAC